jgi:hypothetical protein
MDDQSSTPPVLAYATPARSPQIPFIQPMKRWRLLAGLGLWPTLFGLVVYRPLAVFAATVMCAGIVGALVCMYRAAAAEAGAGYAARHVVLAIILMPLLLLGLFFVTRLVEADLINWRLAERRRSQPASPDAWATLAHGPDDGPL